MKSNGAFSKRLLLLSILTLSWISWITITTAFVLKPTPSSRQAVSKDFIRYSKQSPQVESSTLLCFVNQINLISSMTTTTSTTELLSSNNNNHQFPDKEDKKDQPPDRFLSAKIDDAGLPIADALIAQIVAPTLQVLWLTVNHAPIPSWLVASAAVKASQTGMLYTNTRGELLAPTLIHGAGLAVCWILGALAARAYESDAFVVSKESGEGYGSVIKKIFQAGSFATGLLILSTQVDLFFEYGRYVQPGESVEIDIRLLCAITELINDVAFEAVVLGSWRLYRANITSHHPPLR